MAGRSVLSALAALAILPSTAAAVQPGLNPDFGQDGIAELSQIDGNFTNVEKVRSGPYAGDILAAGELGDGPTCFCGGFLAMFNDDGSLHDQFGDGGIVDDPDLWVRDMAIDSQGRIVIAGANEVVRFRPDGEPDRSFGIAGVATLTSATPGHYLSADSVVTTTDNGIRVGAGEGDPQETRPRGTGIIIGLDPQGTLDDAFGDGGRVTIQTGGIVVISDLALGVGQDIVYAGSLATPELYPNIDRRFFTGRLHSDGAADQSFPATFTAFEPPECPSGCGPNDQARAVAVNESGETFAAGFAAQDWAIAKFRIGGVPDASFGGGAFQTRFPGDLSASANDIVLDGNSHAIAVGTDGLQMALARYRADGGLDAKASTAAPSGSNSELNAADVLDGKLITAGSEAWHPLLAEYALDFPSVFPPTTRIEVRPPRHTARHRAIFGFHSNDPTASFLCWGDFDFERKSCGSRFRTPSLDYGNHFLSVRAVSVDGVQDTGIKTYRFEVRPHPSNRH
jgi:uncharacterized delta-60 repeat protein